MKIALIILHADVARGGAERYTVDLANQLTQRGHGVALIAGSFGTGINTAVERVPLKMSGVTRLQRYKRFLAALEAHLKQTHYDITHAMLPVWQCDVYHPHAGLAAQMMSAGHRKYESRLRQGGAWMANHLNPRRRAFYAVEQHLLNSTNPPVVLNLSDYIRQTVLAHYPALPADRLPTLFNAVDLKRFDPARDPSARARQRQAMNLGDHDVVALFIGQDFQRKGLPQAIAAVQQIHDPRLKLLVVGADHAGGHLHKTDTDNSRVIYVGPTDDPYPYYRAADLFVLPTRHDPCSLVVLEALAMGLPVISTRMNGACEIMTKQHGFVLDDPSDIPALEESLRQLMDEPRRRAMQAACLALRAGLSQEHHLDQLLRIYQQRLSAPPMPSPR
ncbi:MAG: glycosyltransferase family 4 protein [Phycisphaerales bacterium]|nr:glycosyltransferase family 4 protein [Phycisphaerales bacterium]